MRHIIVGTAGHIDHGKTSLIRALTGKNTDRLKEEQDRGISIELGFTYFDLPSGLRAGIVDVPGHERFIKNMLAGVMGIDIILLTVAADEGIMPQTTEHLNILDLIKTRAGFTVITKTDLVEPEWLDMIEEDIREQLKGTFLEKQPILRVSSVTGEGIPRIVELIDSLANEVEDRDSSELARLPIDRVFTIQGFGTVVTGTLLSGKLRKGQEVQIFPHEVRARIRSIQVHDEDVESVESGQRSAINLAGVKKNEVNRGDTLAPPESMKPTMLLDVKVKVLKDSGKSIKNRSRLHLYLASKETMCRIILLDKDEILPGEEAYAQLRLEEQVVGKRGDRFILRFYSPMFTVGGGEILDPNPKKLRKLDHFAVRDFEIKEMGNEIEIVENEILKRSSKLPTIKEIAQELSILEEQLKLSVEELKRQGLVRTYELTKEVVVIHVKYYEELEHIVLELLKEFHRINPLKKGLSKEEVISRLFKGNRSKVGNFILEQMIEEGFLRSEMDLIRTADFQLNLSETQSKLETELRAFIAEKKFQLIRNNDLISEFSETYKQKDAKKDIQEMLDYLIKSEVLIRFEEGFLLLQSDYELAKNLLRKHFETQDQLSVAEFRDLLQTNRKVALAVLERFDEEKFTLRKEDVRILNRTAKNVEL